MISDYLTYLLNAEHCLMMRNVQRHLRHGLCSKHSVWNESLGGSSSAYPECCSQNTNCPVELHRSCGFPRWGIARGERQGWSWIQGRGQAFMDMVGRPSLEADFHGDTAPACLPATLSYSWDKRLVSLGIFWALLTSLMQFQTCFSVLMLMMLCNYNIGVVFLAADSYTSLT